MIDDPRTKLFRHIPGVYEQTSRGEYRDDIFPVC